MTASKHKVTFDWRRDFTRFGHFHFGQENPFPSTYDNFTPNETPDFDEKTCE